MPVAQTLQKVEEDIHAGDLGKASARLRGLIAAYPDNLDLRKQLGEVYWKLKLPGRAGRYWYLVENKDDRMRTACRRFEEHFRNDPYPILWALKFKGDEDAIKGTFAGRALEHLERRISEKYPEMPHVRANLSVKQRHFNGKPEVIRAYYFFAKTGWLIILAIGLLLFVIGLITR